MKFWKRFDPETGRKAGPGVLSSIMSHTVSPPGTTWIARTRGHGAGRRLFPASNSRADPAPMPLPRERNLRTRTDTSPSRRGQGCGASCDSSNEVPKAEFPVQRLGGPALGSPSRMKVLFGPPDPEPRSPEQEACSCPGAQGTQGEGTLPCSGLLRSAPGWAAAAERWEGLE